MADPPMPGSELDPHEISSEISRGIVGIYANLYGRGPNHARTHLGDDFVLTVLEDVFTAAEKTLVGADKGRQVEQSRRAFQDAVEGDFVTIVESATGRVVGTFMSQIDVGSSTAVELFLLRARSEESDESAG